MLLRALAEVPLSAAQLYPLVDYAVAIDTTGPEPTLASGNLAPPAARRGGREDSGGEEEKKEGELETWASFAARWR